MSEITPEKRPWYWPFEKPDWFAALAAWLVSQIAYAWSVQPNVGLLDSGEFLTAAVHMGVPHPTGYPLWTIGSWFFQLLPLGNNAWEVNLFSGVCSAWGIGLIALLLCSSMRWAGVSDRLAQILAWQGGFRIQEVPIVFTERREGQSKMSLQIAQEAALRVLQLALRRIFP